MTEKKTAASPSLQGAVADAMSSPEAQEMLNATVRQLTEGTAEEAEAKAAVPATPASSEGGSELDVTSKQDGPEPEAREGTGEDVPSTYFGVDLSELSPEKRLEVIRAFKEQDTFIGKLLQDRAQLTAALRSAPAAVPPAPEAPSPVVENQPVNEPVSDEAILRALGVDPDDPFGEAQAKVALPLARQLMQMNQTVSSLVERLELQETDRYWNDTLDRMEREYGELPVERVRILEFAADNGIASPEDAYWRIVGPARKALMDRISALRTEQLREGKMAATSPRPRSSAPTQPKKLEAKETRDAVAEAAKLAAEQLGISWDDAIRERLS